MTIRRRQLLKNLGAGVLLLGGIFREGDFSAHVEVDETERIVTEHQKLFAEFG